MLASLFVAWVMKPCSVRLNLVAHIYVLWTLMEMAHNLVISVFEGEKCLYLSSITCFKYICPCLICQKHCLFFIQKLKYYSDLETHSEGNEALQRATFYTQHRHSELLKSSVQRAFLFISQ